MNKEMQAEQLLQSWVRLSAILKNTRITKGLVYNEAIVMLLVYKKYQEDNGGIISVKEIVAKTNMQKSLVNRTVNSLINKDLLQRCDGEGDKRIAYVKCVEEKLDVFLAVHNDSLNLAENIIDIIGEEDAHTFLRIVEKIDKSGYKL